MGNCTRRGALERIGAAGLAGFALEGFPVQHPPEPPTND